MRAPTAIIGDGRGTDSPLNKGPRGATIKY